MNPAAARRTPAEALTALIYELLDAHRDTIELADRRPELAWRAHLEYLRALQRTGRALLARTSAPSDRTSPGSDRTSAPSDRTSPRSDATCPSDPESAR